MRQTAFAQEMAMKSSPALSLFLLLLSQAGAQQPAAPAPASQNPSPMTDTSRAHGRVAQREVAGRRWTLSVGTLLLPATARVRPIMPLYVHFHGAGWLAELSATQRDRHAAILTVQLGAGSTVYQKAFTDPQRFQQLLDEAARALSPTAPPRFHPIVISSFSAGYGAVREILRNHDNWKLIDAIVLADGLHTSYRPEGIPGPLEEEPLAPFLDFAREAVAGRKQFVITHSEIFPGTFASTTQTTDYLIASLGLKRQPLLKWGPGGMQQLSEARAGKLRILGFAGNTAPDHIDHFHGLKQWLKLVR